MTEHDIVFKDNRITLLEDGTYEFTNCYSITMENCSCLSIEQQKDQYIISVAIQPNISKTLWDFVHSVLDTVAAHRNLQCSYEIQPNLFFIPSALYDTNLSENKIFISTVEWKKFRCIYNETLQIIPHFELSKIEFTEYSVKDIIKAQAQVISTIETPMNNRLVGNVSVFMDLDKS